MKKILAAAVSALLLGACASGTSMNGLGSGTGIGSSVVKMAVENQCRTELNKRNEWRMVALAMSAEKQEEWESKICGCASEEAPNQLTANEMMQVLSPSTRTQALATVTAKTVTACVKRVYTGN
ncbi:hypothetical protein CRG49_004825 [Neisseria sp. N95_16]|uniref:Uncharacterized protein n=1 Tax=Neisseria brasiliensis TaxID=2666100 RepID=A0A5Q3S7X8_9NEIS|nr:MULTISPECIES: hypothetical protein [Neisseria]MRN39208.1 hypothetical protein [Neisseria brasiliensis]PJO09946.1 hypothetical protein CRG49_004825 [Neisseria sp. N95_16]PJO78846.1 hypothetical protein CWC45_03045 [Neisseria sp. N177_16]QGL26198.1 hypothetical protein GJV52_12095 [Neisseria brasiliensis]